MEWYNEDCCHLIFLSSYYNENIFLVCIIFNGYLSIWVNHNLMNLRLFLNFQYSYNPMQESRAVSEPQGH